MSLIAASAFIVVAHVSVLGDHPVAPRSYSVLSVDHRHVFVMLAPTSANDSNLISQGERKRALSLRRKYRSSGLYLNNGSTTPLWTVDWYASSVVLPSGGVYLIRMGPWASANDDEAFSFFKEGKALKTYRVKDIVSDPAALPHSVSHFEWLKEKTLNNHEKTFAVTTLLDEKHVFDITTGNVVSDPRSDRLE